MAIQDLFNQVDAIKGFREDVPDYYEYLKSGYAGGTLGEPDVTNALNILLEQSRLAGYGQQQPQAQTQASGVPQNELDTLKGYYSNKDIYNYNPTYVEDLYSGFQSGKYGYNDALNAFRILEQQSGTTATPSSAPQSQTQTPTAPPPPDVNGSIENFYKNPDIYNYNPDYVEDLYQGVQSGKYSPTDAFNAFRILEQQSGTKTLQPEPTLPDWQTDPAKIPFAVASSLYLNQNPDVKNAGLDPYEHYTQYGKNEGRKWPGIETQPTQAVYTDYGPDKYGVGADIIGQVASSDGSVLRTYFSDNTYSDQSWDSANTGIIGQQRMQDASGDWFTRIITSDGKVQDVKDDRNSLSKFFSSSGLGGILTGVPITNAIGDIFGDKTFAKQVVPNLINPVGAANQQIAQTWDAGGKPLDVFTSTLETLADPTNSVNYSLAQGGDELGADAKKWITPVLSTLGTIIYPVAGTALGAGIGQHLAGGTDALQVTPQGTYMASPQASHAAVKGAGTSAGTAYAASAISPYVQSGLNTSPVAANAISTGVASTAMNKAAYNQSWSDAIRNGIIAGTLNYAGGKLVGYLTDANGNKIDAKDIPTDFSDQRTVALDELNYDYGTSTDVQTAMPPEQWDPIQAGWLDELNSPSRLSNIDNIQASWLDELNSPSRTLDWEDIQASWLDELNSPSRLDDYHYYTLDELNSPSRVGTMNDYINNAGIMQSWLEELNNPSRVGTMDEWITKQSMLDELNSPSRQAGVQGSSWWNNLSNMSPIDIINSIISGLGGLLTNPILSAALPTIIGGLGAGTNPQPTPTPGDVIFPGGVDSSGEGTGSSAFFADQGGTPSGSAGLEAALARLSKILSSGPIYGGIKGYKGEQYYT